MSSATQMPVTAIMSLPVSDRATMPVREPLAVSHRKSPFASSRQETQAQIDALADDHAAVTLELESALRRPVPDRVKVRRLSRAIVRLEERILQLSGLVRLIGRDPGQNAPEARRDDRAA